MYFDTHAHLDDEAFDADREELIGSFAEVGVGRIINASSDMPSSYATVSLCEKYDFIYGAVGIHPEAADRMESGDIEKIAELTKKKNIVAIGETGLDYYWDSVPREVQQKAFREHCALARELNLPIVVHDREAHRDCLDILKEFPGIRAVYHCFSGSVEYARELSKLGFYFSFGGAVTFKNAKAAPEVLRNLPREQVMLETDCPYMAPVPFRGKRNHPGYVPHIAAKIAEIWGISPEEVGRITTENALRFFNIK
ncbi:MAG: TatD family hydrolase [Oscillospiraceae bacterium]|nr:TatD family hydrolase [Oscillospiraceae bacterium]